MLEFELISVGFLMDFLFFPRSGSAVGTLAPSLGGRGPTLGIAFGTFFSHNMEDCYYYYYYCTTATTTYNFILIF